MVGEPYPCNDLGMALTVDTGLEQCYFLAWQPSASFERLDDLDKNMGVWWSSPSRGFLRYVDFFEKFIQEGSSEFRTGRDTMPAHPRIIFLCHHAFMRSELMPLCAQELSTTLNLSKLDIRDIFELVRTLHGNGDQVYSLLRQKLVGNHESLAGLNLPE